MVPKVRLNMKSSVNLTKTLSLLAGFIFMTLIITSCAGSSTLVKGTIMCHDGEPFAGKEVVLVPLLPGEKIEIFSPSKGGTREVLLSVWNIDILGGEKIIFATGRSGRAMKAETDSKGSFVIKNIDPGKYILLWMVAGSAIVTGTKDGFIRVVSEQGKTSNLGKITLLPSNESVIKWEKKHSQD